MDFKPKWEASKKVANEDLEQMAPKLILLYGVLLGGSAVAIGFALAVGVRSV